MPPLRGETRAIRHSWSSRGRLAIVAAALAFSACARDAGEPPGEAPGGPATEPRAAAGQGAAWIAIPNAKMPLDGVLVGGQPTREQLAEASAAGYRTIVNTRMPGELTDWDERAVVSELGMRYVEIPVDGVGGLTVDNAQRLAAVLDDPQAGPVIVHCASGNRVGALLAVKAKLVDGATVEQAVALGERAGMRRLTAATRQLLEAQP